MSFQKYLWNSPPSLHRDGFFFSTHMFIFSFIIIIIIIIII